MKAVNASELGLTFDCPSPNCPGEASRPGAPCPTCESGGPHRPGLVFFTDSPAGVEGARHRSPNRREIDPAHPLERPSPRELEVLAVVACGYTNREIGERLFLGQQTVASHIKHALVKLNARDRAHAIAICLREGFLR